MKRHKELMKKEMFKSIQAKPKRMKRYDGKYAVLTQKEQQSE